MVTFKREFILFLPQEFKNQHEQKNQKDYQRVDVTMNQRAWHICKYSGFFVFNNNIKYIYYVIVTLLKAVQICVNFFAM